MRFRVTLDPEVDLDEQGRLRLVECNCSICSATGFLHLIVPRARFELTTSEEKLQEYRFGSGTARHLFCRRCGIKSFYVPRSHPEGFSVHARCVDFEPAGLSLAEARREPFDGRNWEANIDALHRS